ncbi:MAG: nuclear transport factor 2 family protein [Bacteroidetes bacterium]|nr:nuclear transport factor 2 family protein [Bacteroidota bacterium]
MKLLRFLLVYVAGVVAAATVSASLAHAQTARASAPEAEAVVRRVYAAAENRDLDALGRLYAPDVHIIEGTGLDEGWARYRDHHLAPELEAFQTFHYRPIAMVSRRLSPRAALVHVRYALQARTASDTLDLVGRATFVLERTGQTWRVVHTQSSGRARRPSDPPFPS